MGHEAEQMRTSARRLPRSSWYVAAAMSLAVVVAGCGASGSGEGSRDGDPTSEPTDSANPGPMEVAEDLSEVDPATVAGTGTAVITISGIEYEFTGDYCVSLPSSFEILGSGTSDAGSFYAEITIDDDADLDDDGAADKLGDVSVTVGDDESIYKSIVLITGMGAGEDFTYELGDGSATGSGRIVDAMAGGTNDFEFSAQCA